jgi:hypothetical protein
VRGASEFWGLEVMLTGNPPVAIKFKSVPRKMKVIQGKGLRLIWHFMTTSLLPPKLGKKVFQTGVEQLTAES